MLRLSQDREEIKVVCSMLLSFSVSRESGSDASTKLCKSQSITWVKRAPIYANTMCWILEPGGAEEHRDLCSGEVQGHRHRAKSKTTQIEKLRWIFRTFERN